MACIRRRIPSAALAFARSVSAGEFMLMTPTELELDRAIDLLERYENLGIDLPDAVVMAIAQESRSRVLTWDFRDFRAVVDRSGNPLSLLVNEWEMPGS